MRKFRLGSGVLGLLFAIAALISMSANASTVTTVNSIDKADPYELWSWTDPDQAEVVLSSGGPTELELATVPADKLLVINYFRIGPGSSGTAGIYERPIGTTGSQDIRRLGGNFLDNSTNNADGPLAVQKTGIHFPANSKVILKWETGNLVKTRSLTLKGFLAKNTIQATGADLDIQNVEIPNPGKYFNYVSDSVGGGTVLAGQEKVLVTLATNEILCINYARNLGVATKFKIVHKDGATNTQLLAGDLFTEDVGPLSLGGDVAICSPAGGRVVLEAVQISNTKDVHVMGFKAIVPTT